MKTKLMLASFCSLCLAFTSFAGIILTNDAEYTLTNVPRSVKALLSQNQSLEFEIQENATTGFVWNVSYDKNLCQVMLEHKAAESGICGKPGKVEVKIISLTNKPFAVELDCSRPWEREKNKGRIMRCMFNLFDAPEFHSSKEEGGNVSIADDSSFTLANIPGRAVLNVRPGKDIEFKLEETLEKNLIWSLTQCDPSMAKVEIEHDAGKLMMTDKAKIKISGIRPGYTVLKFAYGNPGAAVFIPEREIICFLIVQ